MAAGQDQHQTLFSVRQRAKRAQRPHLARAGSSEAGADALVSVRSVKRIDGFRQTSNSPVSRLRSSAKAAATAIMQVVDPGNLYTGAAPRLQWHRYWYDNVSHLNSEICGRGGTSVDDHQRRYRLRDGVAEVPLASWHRRPRLMPTMTTLRSTVTSLLSSALRPDQKISMKMPTTTAKPIRKITPMVPPRNFNIADLLVECRGH